MAAPIRVYNVRVTLADTSETPYTIPTGTREIRIKPITNDLSLYAASGDTDYYTITSGSTFALNVNDSNMLLGGQVLYFKGLANDVIEIFYVADES